MKAKLNEFNEYLESQVGQPYVWGGQHLKLTPETYMSIITRKESDPTYRLQAIDFCDAKFASGAEVLYGYDCSGLGMYFLQNLKHVFPNDMNAHSMWTKCEETLEPKKGYWVFRFNNGKASHIGYMVSDTEVVHAKGRKYGVVKEQYRSSYWHKVGIPNCIEFEEGPEPVPMEYEIQVKGSVHVRTGNGKKFPKIGTAKDCRLIYLGQAEEEPFWYKTVFKGQGGFISCASKYTKLIRIK